MSDFDDTMNVAGDDQLNSKPEDLEKTRVADPQTLGAEGDAPVDDAAVTVDATDVDPALVDEILAEITGATAAGEPLDAGDEGAEEPAADAEDQSVEPQTPPIDVLTGSDMMAEASPAAAPVVEAAQASLLGSDAGEAPKGKFRKRALIAAVVVLALLAAAYFAGSMAFGRVFLPGTTINGEDVSLKSVEEVAKANSDSIDSFELNVSGDGVSLQVKAKDRKSHV